MDREEMRKKMSALLMDTNEKEGLLLDVVIGESEAEGLGYSTNDLPRVRAAFQLPSEGIIYFVIYGADEPMEFDDMNDDDLEALYEPMENASFWDDKVKLNIN
jgi:hypothetical protein